MRLNLTAILATVVVCLLAVSALAERAPERFSRAQVLADFLDFNDFLGAADDLLHDLGLEGELQIASFHPQFQFAGTDAQDLSNATNRSPHPCLHLLREQSIERAVASFPEPEAIFEANIRTLEVLGAHGWAALQDACRRDAQEGKHPPEV